MEVVRCEITHCHGTIYAFLLFQGKAVMWRNFQLKIFGWLILCRFFWLLCLKLKMQQVREQSASWYSVCCCDQERSSVQVFGHLVLLSEGESPSDEAMWMQKRQEISKALTNPFLKLLRHECLLLPRADGPHLILKSWAQLDHPGRLSIPDEMWQWKTWHELMSKCLLRSQVHPGVPLANLYQSPGWVV